MKSYKRMCESTTELGKELYKAIQTGGGSIEIVDKVEKNNMNAVTSNAVSKAIPEISGVVDVVEKDNMNAVTSNAVYTAINEDTGTSKVSIKVSDVNTQFTIENATVKIDEETLKTNNLGECTFENVKHGLHILKVSHIKYDDYVEGIYIKDDLKNVTVSLDEKIVTNDIRIAGKIVDDKGNLPGVKILENKTGINTYTGSDGTFVLYLPKENVETEINIYFSKKYYIPISAEVKLNSDIRYYNVGTNTLELSFTENQISNVKGITQYSDEKVPGVYYYTGYVNFIFRSRLTGKEFTFKSDENGIFNTENGINPGWYDILVKNNREYADDVIENGFFIRPEETLTNFKITVMKAITHEFILTTRYNDSKEFVKNTNLEIYSNESMTEKIAQGSTNDNGDFTFHVSNDLTGHLYAKIYLSTEDIRTADIGLAGLSKQVIYI